MVVLIFLVELLFQTTFAAHAGDGMQPCYPKDIAKGRGGCKVLKDTFIFNSSLTCNKQLFKDVELLEGQLIFTDMSYQDPMACFPNLKRIIMPNRSPFNKSEAILITNTVRNMENFTVNRHLVMYGKNEKLITIKAKNYRMEWKTFLFLSSRFGSKRLNVEHKSDGECNFMHTRKPIVYFMSELDECKRIEGPLRITRPKALETSTNLIEINGCIEISNTNFTLDHVYFLRQLKRISCLSPYAIFEGNRNLCLPTGYLKILIKAYVDLNAAERETLLANTLKRSNNKNLPMCGRSCSADDIEEEQAGTLCEHVYGPLRMRKSIVKNIAPLKMIKGRLIIDGYGSTEPFRDIPHLQIIDTFSGDAAIQITNNRILGHVEIPRNLTIKSEATILIRIEKNYPYKMSRKMYDTLAAKYGKERLKIDVLDNNECFFRNPIYRLSELDNCTYITGDLHIASNVTGTTKTLLRRVTGCIKIIGTTLTELPFLNRIDSTSSMHCDRNHIISKNKKLCPGFWLEKLKATKGGKGYSLLSSVGNKHPCHSICTREHLYETTNCEVVTEGITMSKRELRLFKDSLANVEETMGTISIKRTNLKKIDLFSSLKKITVHEYGPALDIQYNQNLEEVDISSLEEIVSDDQNKTLIVIRNNGQYIMPKKQYKELEEKFGKERIDIDHKEDTKVKIVYNYEYGIVIGVCCAVVLVIIIVVAIMIVFVVRVARDKRNKKKEKCEEKKPLVKSAEKIRKSGSKKPSPEEEGDYDYVEFEHEAGSAKKADVQRNDPVVSDSSMDKNQENAPETVKAVTINPIDDTNDVGHETDNASVVKPVVVPGQDLDREAMFNISFVSQAVTVKSAGNQPLKGDEHTNASVMQNAQTAKSANMGNRNYELQKDMPVVDAQKSHDNLKPMNTETNNAEGKIPPEEGRVSQAETVNTAQIGQNACSGLVNNNSNVRTANTAVLGGTVYDGLAGNKSTANTANTAAFGNKTYFGMNTEIQAAPNDSK